MFCKVQSVKTLPEFNLQVDFEDGESRLYDMKPLFEKWEVFRSLAVVAGLFEQVKVDVGGYGISWNDEIDLSCEELYHNGLLIN